MNIKKLTVFAIGIAIFPGCAHFSKTSTTRHELVKYGAAVPPQWQVIAPVGSQDLPGGATNGYVTLASPAGTNAAAGGLFAPKPRIFVAYHETWTDRSRGGGTFVFTDPSASQVASTVTNQAALGGAHTFTVGAVSSTITTNAVAAISAGGTAVGNIIGAAASAATGTGAAGSAVAGGASVLTQSIPVATNVVSAVATNAIPAGTNATPVAH